MAKESKRFEIKHNNMFMFSFVEVIRYYKFLEIILDRHKPLAASYLGTLNKFTESTKKMGEGNQQFTFNQIKLNDNLSRLGPLVQLEVESFYLFSKMLLDKIARAIEFYFGQAEKLSLDSHDDFTKKIQRYSNIKGLILHEGLLNLAQELKEDISDFRDSQIAHHKSPRTARGTTGDGRMLLVQIYPTDKDEQKETKPLDDLMVKIDMFIELVVQFVENNREKTNLELKLT